MALKVVWFGIQNTIQSGEVSLGLVGCECTGEMFSSLLGLSAIPQMPRAEGEKNNSVDYYVSANLLLFLLTVSLLFLLLLILLSMLSLLLLLLLLLLGFVSFRIRFICFVIRKVFSFWTFDWIFIANSKKNTNKQSFILLVGTFWLRRTLKYKLIYFVH